MKQSLLLAPARMQDRLIVLAFRSYTCIHVPRVPNSYSYSYAFHARVTQAEGVSFAYKVGRDRAKHVQVMNAYDKLIGLIQNTCWCYADCGYACLAIE